VRKRLSAIYLPPFMATGPWAAPGGDATYPDPGNRSLDPGAGIPVGSRSNARPTLPTPDAGAAGPIPSHPIVEALRGFSPLL